MKKISLIILLISVLTFTMISCGNKTEPRTDSVLYSSNDGSTVELGTGENHFSFTVTDSDNLKYDFYIHTDKSVVGEALEELGLIEGTEGDFGIYVNRVNGIYAEYEVTGTYWAFYINGEYALTGIDVTEIVNGASYEMKIEK